MKVPRQYVRWLSSFWHSRQTTFQLYIYIYIDMARKFLSAPPTSAPSEWLFSGVGILYDEQRNRLSPEHAEMLLSIKYKYLFD